MFKLPTDFWVPSLIHALDFSEYLALFGFLCLKSQLWLALMQPFTG